MEEEDILCEKFKNELRALQNYDLNGINEFIEKDQHITINISNGALLTYLVEAKRRNWSEDQVIHKGYLNTETDKTSAKTTNASDESGNLFTLFHKNSSSGNKGILDVISKELARTRARKDQLIAFRCQVHHEICNSFQGRVGRPQCLIQMTLLSSRSDQPKHRRLVFICSKSELQDVLSQFKDLVHVIKSKR